MANQKAPTTAEVTAALDDEGIADWCWGPGAYHVLKHWALPLAEERDRLAAELRALADVEDELSYEARTQRELADTLTADVCDLRAEAERLRPLADLGALALAWGRALVACETDPQGRENAMRAQAALSGAACRMAEKEGKGDG
jgi:hypothetical protein